MVRSTTVCALACAPSTGVAAASPSAGALAATGRRHGNCMNERHGTPAFGLPWQPRGLM